ncbi:hypothetical protein SHIRM173S_05350 [Streptomyces hirsutus]
MAYRRARLTFLRGSLNSWRSWWAANSTGTTLPHGPAPQAAATLAARHPVSSKSCSRQSSAGSRSVDFHAPSVTILRSPEAVVRASTPMRPAGPTVRLVAETARTFVPERMCARTSMTSGRRHLESSVSRAVLATSVPLTEAT